MPEQAEIFRPYLQIAVFCERVLREQDGVLSIIRIIDRFNIPGSSPEMPITPIKFTVVIQFKSGFLRGKHSIHLRPKSPQKADLPGMEFPVLFEGDDDRGIALAFEVTWPVSEEGLYWWEVYLNAEMVTKMPLRVDYLRTALPIAGA